MSPKPSKSGRPAKPKGVKPPKGSGIPTGSASSARPADDQNGSAQNGSAQNGTAPRNGAGQKSSAPKSSAPKTPVQQTGQVDVAAIARALFAGFIILVFGGLLTPAATHFIPPAIGQFWLIFVAVVAFATAGVWAGRSSPKPPLYGSGTAVGSFVMDVPLLFLNNTFDPMYAFYTLVAAAAIGAVAGMIGARVAPASR